VHCSVCGRSEESEKIENNVGSQREQESVRTAAAAQSIAVTIDSELDDDRSPATSTRNPHHANNNLLVISK